MAAADDLEAVLDRVARGRYTDADFHRLRNAVWVRGDSNTLQVGHNNVRIGRGSVQVGDRHYHGIEARNLSEVLKSLAYTDQVHPGRGGPSVGRGALRSFGGFVFTIGMLVIAGGVLVFLLSMVPLMKGADYTQPTDQMIGGFVVAAVGMVVTWIGQVIRRLGTQAIEIGATVDPATLSVGLAAVVARLVPVLTGLGESAAQSAAEEAARRLGEASVQRVATLWQRLWAGMSRRPTAWQAVAQAAADAQGAAGGQGALARELAPLLRAQPGLAREVAELLQQIPAEWRAQAVAARGVGSVHVTGDRNVVQSGGMYNISTGDGGNVHVGDRHYGPNHPRG